MKTILGLLLVLVVCAPMALAEPASDLRHIAGSWVVSRYDFGPVSAADETQAQKVIGTIASISAGEIRFGDFRCTPKSVRSKRVDASAYLASFKANPKDLGIAEKQITIIDTGCDATPFKEIMMPTQNVLIFSWDGAFYFLG